MNYGTCLEVRRVNKGVFMIVQVEYVSRRGRRKPFVVEIDPRRAGYDLSRPAAVTAPRRGRQQAPTSWYGTPRRAKQPQFFGGLRIK